MTPAAPATDAAIERAFRDALALHRAGRLHEAERCYSEIIAIRPGHVDALNNRGIVLRALGRGAQALASYDTALAIGPDNPDTLYNRGNVLQDLGRASEAVVSYEQALAQRPGHISALVNLGNALRALGQYEEAIARYDRALALDPGCDSALNCRGIALQRLGRDHEALASYEAALAHRPDNAEALTNRGYGLRVFGRYDEALASYEAALRLRPHDPDARWNMSIARLCLGDWVNGWREYEWRWQTAEFAGRRRDFGKPQWRGEQAVENRTILLHAEQGLGDTIQFIRYAQCLLERGAHVVAEVQPPLLGLISASLPVPVIGRGAALPAFDLHCPLMSLPLAFGTTLATAPAKVPYLTAAADGRARWRQRLARDGAPVVALAWSGSRLHRNDHHRSIPLARLAPLLAVPGIRFVCAQAELRNEDVEALTQLPQIERLEGALRDFTDTAAVLAAADLVISVDTAVAHLAGALARPLWLLLPFAPDFRWLLGREDTPWYPTARLFRQPAPGDWASAIAQARDELARC